MEKIFPLLILLQISCIICDLKPTHLRYRFASRNKPLDDLKALGQPLFQAHERTSFHCQNRCIMKSGCSSVAYNTISRLCRGYDAEFQLNRVIDKVEQGWIHFDRQIIEGCEKATMSGIYFVKPPNIDGFEAYCYVDLDSRGWVVIQRRQDGLTDFMRMWNDYKVGFGDLERDFWLGNDKINQLTSVWNYELRIDIGDWEGNTWFALYRVFALGTEATKYQLTVAEYNGTAGDSLSYHNGMFFTTSDNDNDNYAPNVCTNGHGGGGWWYNACDTANLNGLFPEGSGEQGIEWTAARSGYSMKYSRMMIRRKMT